MFIFMMMACGPEPLLPMLEGKLTPEGHDVHGDFYGYKAFGFDNDGTLVVYIASQKEADCTTVSQFMRSTADPVDPSLLFESQSCNLMLKTAGYEGSWEVQDDRMESASSSISCTMGDGEWVYETGPDKGYYWSGNWWAGFPIEYKWKVSGDRDSEYVLDLEMSVYEGSFPREEFSRYPATGMVSGLVTAEVCTELGQSEHF
jgi:hypothetical protein